MLAGLFWALIVITGTVLFVVGGHFGLV